jgi:predicted small lipoprotein YifL
MKNSVRNAAALLLALFLFGCGQSGPLYVSGNPSSIQPVGDQTTAEDEEEEAAAKTDEQ